MKKGIKALLILIIIIIIIGSIIGGIYFYKLKNNLLYTLEGVVVKVNDYNLSIMDDDKNLYTVSFAKEGNIGFNINQEIEIYFDGMIMTSYPEQIRNVGKIEIIKEKSDISIPKDVLIRYYSSPDNVSLNINKISNKGLEISIKDTNNLKYTYSKNYTIYKKVKNEDYTGIGYQIGENTGNSFAGFSRNRFGIYLERSR